MGHDLEARVDPGVVGARHFVSEIDEGAKVARLRREELLVKGVEIGWTALAQRLGKKAKPLARARFDERRDEKPIDERRRCGKAVSRRHPLSIGTDDLAQVGCVGVERRWTEWYSPSFELAEHAAKMRQLFLGQRHQMAHDLRRLRGTNGERQSVARRFHLAMGVIDENGIEIGERRFDPTGGRRLREAQHGREVYTLLAAAPPEESARTTLRLARLRQFFAISDHDRAK